MKSTDDKLMGCVTVIIVAMVAITVLAFPVVFAVKLCGGIDSTYSEGSRVGVLQKFSKKGLVNKSWEGELATPGFETGEDKTVSNTWAFSVEDEKVAEQILKTKIGSRVRVTYRQVTMNSTRFDTDYRVEKIEDAP